MQDQIEREQVAGVLPEEVSAPRAAIDRLFPVRAAPAITRVCPLCRRPHDPGVDCRTIRPAPPKTMPLPMIGDSERAQKYAQKRAAIRARREEKRRRKAGMVLPVQAGLE